jgi:nitroimidazol reductase NimA-like FMN-containing flavoprotein (pyridoxamine 5'-phosphate oxidase superfamily)
VYAILDEGFICHVAASVDGSVYVIPTAYGRDANRLVLHGAAANHVLKAASEGAELTITVTLLDGLVLARSTFNHSLNYRSVVIFAHATEVTDLERKAADLACIVDHMLPGRTAEARPPTPIELTKTRVVTVDLDEVSAKVRTGLPVDEPEDVALPVWAGVIPLRTSAGPLIPDPANQAGLAEPAGAHQPDRWDS